MSVDIDWNREFCCALSLGSICHAAMALKKAGLRTFSGPFDWIFSNPDVVTHCIEDDFRTLLDRSQYIDVPESDRTLPEANICHHRLYRDKFGVQFMFNHYSPNDDERHGYLNRCVDRFRLAMRHPQPKLLLLMTWRPFNLDGLMGALAGYGTEFLLLEVRWRVDEDKPGIATLATEGNDGRRACLTLATRTPSNGVVFADEEDNRALNDWLARLSVARMAPREIIEISRTPHILDAATFDEGWYLDTYGDVADAVRQGLLKSGWEHYEKYGMKEFRMARIRRQ